MACKSVFSFPQYVLKWESKYPVMDYITQITLVCSKFPSMECKQRSQKLLRGRYCSILSPLPPTECKQHWGSRGKKDQVNGRSMIPESYERKMGTTNSGTDWLDNKKLMSIMISHCIWNLIFIATLCSC